MKVIWEDLKRIKGENDVIIVSKFLNILKQRSRSYNKM